jgi:hypothetical protein
VVRIGSFSFQVIVASQSMFTVTRERKAAKFWLVPVRLEYNHGFGPTELNKVEGIVRDHEIQLVQAWHDYFKSGN